MFRAGQHPLTPITAEHFATADKPPIIASLILPLATYRGAFMSKKYDIYALGNALVDTEVEVSEAFLTRAGVDKGVMTLVDEARQQDLLTAVAMGRC